MTLYELLRACGNTYHQASSVERPECDVIVKYKNQHPCDPPVGIVVDYHYNYTTETHEILIS